MLTHGNAIETRRSDSRFMAFVISLVAVTMAVSVVSSSAFLVAALCIGLAAVAVLRFEWFVYTQVFLLPWYPLLDTTLPVRDVSLVLRFLVLVGVWIIRRQKGKSVVQWFLGSRIKKAVLIFAGIASGSLLISAFGPNTNALRSLVRLFSYLAFFFAIVGWIETREQIEKIVKVVLSSTIVVALFGFYQVLEQGYTDLYFHLYPLQEEGLEPWNGRIVSLLFHFNSLAGYLNLVLPFSLGCMVLARERGLRYLAFVCHALAGAALYFTASRGGLIAYGGMLLISLWFLKPRLLAISRILSATALAAVIVLSLQQGSASRLQEVDEFTSATRLALWGAAGSMFFEHPVLGVGYGNYRALYNDYLPGVTPDQLDAHNLYLQFLGETGIIGFGAFCLLAWLFARTAIKLARNSDSFYCLVGIGMGGVLAATLIHGLVDYLFNGSPQFGGLFWLVMALGLATFDQTKTETAVAAGNKQS